MSKVVRSVKNVTKGYSSVQVKVRNGMSCFTPFSCFSFLRPFSSIGFGGVAIRLLSLLSS